MFKIHLSRYFLQKLFTFVSTLGSDVITMSGKGNGVFQRNPRKCELEDEVMGRGVGRSVGD